MGRLTSAKTLAIGISNTAHAGMFASALHNGTAQGYYDHVTHASEFPQLS